MRAVDLALEQVADEMPLLKRTRKSGRTLQSVHLVLLAVLASGNGMETSGAPSLGSRGGSRLARNSWP